MSGRQLKQYAQELYPENYKQVLKECLQQLIHEKGWSVYITFEEAVQTHSKRLETLIKNYDV